MNVRRKPRRHPYAKPAPTRERKPVFTPLQFSIIAIATAVIFVGGALFLRVTSGSAYDISARHDLQLFADFQKFHYTMNGTCLGEQGDSLRNDGLPSTIVIPNYSLSKGVAITIVAGSPENPYDDGNPFTMQAKHKRSSTVYEYSFATDKIIER